MIFPKLYQPEKSCNQTAEKIFLVLPSVADMGLFLEWAYNAAASMAPASMRHCVDIIEWRCTRCEHSCNCMRDDVALDSK